MDIRLVTLVPLLVLQPSLLTVESFAAYFARVHQLVGMHLTVKVFMVYIDKDL